MNNIYKLFTLFLILVSNNVLGQSFVKDAYPKTGHIDFYEILAKKLKDSTASKTLNICATSIIFAKFTIDVKGNVKDISFSGDKNCPSNIKKLLISVIKQSDGTWVPSVINNKKVESKPFILPLIYRLESGCQTHSSQGDIGSAIINILNFDGNESNTKKENDKGQLNCILLVPLNIFSQN